MPTSPRVSNRADGDGGLGVLGGLAALSLDALSSVAYGPQAMITVLVLAGADGLRYAVPLTLVIVAMLVLLVISYTQVISAYPEGGGSYAVAKDNLGRFPALLAAGSLVVDYVLTVAVSLAAGAASLGSVFPSLSNHLLLISLIGLVLLTVVNLFGINESARLLMGPTVLFIAAMFAVIIVGPFHPHPVATIGTPIRESAKALTVLLVLKAFASGCSAVTGVEAIANGVPSFREPRIRHAQRTEIALGFLLALMLLGLSLLIHHHHLVPRQHVTVLAEATAGAFGTGWMFYVANLAVTAVLGFAANTSFGGLPVLMSLLGRDNRLPHVFYLRAEKPVYRYGIVALALLAVVLLVASGAQTNSLIPLFTIGVFVGLTISQVGLVRHWLSLRPPHWRLRITLNGAGASMTAVAVVIFLVTKFLAGAWVVVIAVPLLIWLFSASERYYDEVASELRLGRNPPLPKRRDSIVIVPTFTVNLVTERALSAALSLGETVVAVAVAGNEEESRQIRENWKAWRCAVPLEVLIDPHRSLVRSVLDYIERNDDIDATITVLISEVVPRKPYHEIYHNQRGRVLAAVLRNQTDVVIATLPLRLHD
jgi:amino acid transporter